MKMKKRTPKQAKNIHQLGTVNNNSMANKNGLDEIDLWAAGLGECDRTLKSLTPNRKHFQIF